MFGADPFGTVPFGASGSSAPPAPPPISSLLSAAALDTIYLVEIYAFDTVSLVDAPIFVSDRLGYITEPDDDPPNRVYLPRLDLPPYFERSIPIAPEDGVRARLAIGELGIANGDGAFDQAVKSYSIDGRRVVIRLGSPSFAFADFITLFDGTAAGWRRADDGTVRVELRDISFRLEKPIQQTLYAGTGGLEGGPELAAKPKPKPYGYVENITATLVDSARQIYQIGDGRVGRIRAVYDSGLPLSVGGDIDDIEAVPPPPGVGPHAEITGFVETEIRLPFTVAAGAANTCLLVQIACGGSVSPPDLIDSVTRNGAAFTRAVRRQQVDPDPHNENFVVDLWVLAAPQAGNGDIVAELSPGFAFVLMQATLLTGVDQDQPSGAVASAGESLDPGNARNVAISTTRPNALLWAGITQFLTSAGFDPADGITERLDRDDTSMRAWAGSRVAAAPGAYTMEATSGAANVTWAMAALEILPAEPGGGIFVTSEAQGLFRLFDTPVGLVTADVEGDALNNVFVSRTADIARRIIDEQPDLEIDIDGASVVALNAAQPAPVGIVIGTEVRSAAAILDELMAGVSGWWGPDRLGRIQLGRIEPPSGTGQVRLTADDILELELLAMPESVDPPNWRRRVGWGVNWTIQTTGLSALVSPERKAFLAEGTRVEPDADDAVKAIFLEATDPPPTAGLFRDAGAAKTEATRLRTIFGVRRRLFRVVTKLKPALVEPGQSIVIDDPRYGLAGGVLVLVTRHRIDCDRNQVTMEVMT